MINNKYNNITYKGNKPLISIITVVYNNVYHIKQTIESVLAQDYPFIEYVVIDGNSSDGTLEIIQEYQDKISFLLSESDNGIYDALNKGIKNTNGDVIAILHSDDLYYDEYVVSDMVQKMEITDSEICFSDIVILDYDSGKVLRYYFANFFSKWLFRVGWMPPHPGCFIKKSLFNEFGMYSTDFKIAGDFDFLVRIFFSRKIYWSYLNRISVKMLEGGTSNSGLKSKKIIANEISRSLSNNNVWSLSVFQLLRYLIRILELTVKPKKL